MIIGDKNRFAVEFEVNAEHGGEWLFGKFCYWISGSRRGDYELGTSLRDVLFQMKYVVGDCGDRRLSSCSGTANEIFAMIDEAIYGENTLSLECPARFDVTIPIDVFNQEKIFLMDCDGEQKSRLLYLANEEVRFETLPVREFDSVIREAYATLEAYYERLGVT